MSLQEVVVSSDKNSKGKAPITLEIWSQFKRGDEKAFAHLYEAYFYLLYNYGTRFTADKELVKDSIHDLFMNLRKYRSTLNAFENHINKASDPVKFYLYKSFRRILTKKLSGQEIGLLAAKIPDNYHFDVMISCEESLVLEETRKTRIEQLNKSLKKLPPRQKEAIYLRFYEGYSFEQIAGLMGSNNIKSTRGLIYKALDNLRKYLETHIPVLFSFLL